VLRFPVRVYADTSVFGGVFDEEFAFASRRFFDRVSAGAFRLVTSPIVEEELADAPAEVRQFGRPIMDEAEEALLSDEVLRLHEAYLEARVVGERRGNDALHVALASAAGCAAIVSWNFKHIVHLEKIPLHNAVNAMGGYYPIAIHSPLEVIEYGDEEV
jgi:predicted nucleic acid-binding protein